MRKLKLQVQMTVDGFVCGPNGELDWAMMQWTDDVKKYVTELTDSCDTILLGHNMTDGFVKHWEAALEKPESEEYSFAKKMVDYPKIVFSTTLTESKWNNTTLHNSLDIINELKNKDGKDIIVYGGATFVSSLIEANLIDEYYLVINPAAIGSGRRIFGDNYHIINLTLLESRTFDSGKVLNRYKPKDK